MCQGRRRGGVCNQRRLRAAISAASSAFQKEKKKRGGEPSNKMWKQLIPVKKKKTAICLRENFRGKFCTANKSKYPLRKAKKNLCQNDNSNRGKRRSSFSWAWGAFSATIATPTAQLNNREGKYMYMDKLYATSKPVGGRLDGGGKRKWGKAPWQQESLSFYCH